MTIREALIDIKSKLKDIDDGDLEARYIVDITSCPLGTDDLKRKQAERRGGRYRCPSSQPTATVR